MNNICVLPMEREHCEQVAQVAKNNLPERLSLESLLDVLRYEHNHFYLAYDNQKELVIGFAGMMIIVDEAELLYIAVEPPYRNQGIGQLLMDQVIDEAKNHHAKRLLLEVRESNRVAQSFYRKNDFDVIAGRKEYYKNPTEDALIMERIISA